MGSPPRHQVLSPPIGSKSAASSTLGVSLWIAFGPLRHRLPKPLTRLGKYSAVLKLLFLSGVCWVTLFRFMSDDVPSAPINWMLGCLGTLLFCGAVFVITRKQAHHTSNQPGASSPAPHLAPKAAAAKVELPKPRPVVPSRPPAPAP